MNRMPSWGPALYDPQNLQRYAPLAKMTWSSLLRMKRWQIVGVFGLYVFGACFLTVSALYTLYVTFYVLKNGGRYGLLLLSLYMLVRAYSSACCSLRLFYYLYVDKRDIAKVLESQIDYGRQHNIWP